MWFPVIVAGHWTASGAAGIQVYTPVSIPSGACPTVAQHPSLQTSFQTQILSIFVVGVACSALSLAKDILNISRAHGGTCYGQCQGEGGQHIRTQPDAILLIFIYLKFAPTERVWGMFHLLIHFPNSWNNHIWARQNLQSQNSNEVSHVGAKGLCSCHHPLFSAWCVDWELAQDWSPYGMPAF